MYPQIKEWRKSVQYFDPKINFSHHYQIGWESRVVNNILIIGANSDLAKAVVKNLENSYNNILSCFKK